MNYDKIYYGYHLFHEHISFYHQLSISTVILNVVGYNDNCSNNDSISLLIFSYPFCLVVWNIWIMFPFGWEE